MTEWAHCVRIIACSWKKCALKTGIVETSGHAAGGMQYSGVAQCLECGRKWDYSRVEGGAAKVMRQ